MREQQTLGRRIQEARKAAGLSQESLGERLGVSRQAVSKWEADAAVPELENLIAMSRIFGVTIGALLGVEPEAAEDRSEKDAPEAPGEGVEGTAPAGELTDREPDERPCFVFYDIKIGLAFQCHNSPLTCKTYRIS